MSSNKGVFVINNTEVYEYDPQDSIIPADKRYYVESDFTSTKCTSTDGEWELRTGRYDSNPLIANKLIWGSRFTYPDKIVFDRPVITNIRTTTTSGTATFLVIDTLSIDSSSTRIQLNFTGKQYSCNLTSRIVSISDISQGVYYANKSELSNADINPDGNFYIRVEFDEKYNMSNHQSYNSANYIYETKQDIITEMEQIFQNSEEAIAILSSLDNGYISPRGALYRLPTSQNPDSIYGSLRVYGDALTGVQPVQCIYPVARILYSLDELKIPASQTELTICKCATEYWSYIGQDGHWVL